VGIGSTAVKAMELAAKAVAEYIVKKTRRKNPGENIVIGVDEIGHLSMKKIVCQ
jgi:hypothetical protein